MSRRTLCPLFLAFAVVGCGGGGGNSGTSYVISANAVPNVGALSITANGTLVLNNALFGTASSGFVGVGAGTNSIVYLTNAGGTQLASGTTDFLAAKYYTAFAVGSAVNQFLFFYPTDASTPAANTGRLIFVNASVLQPSVDVYVTPNGGTQGSPVISSMTPFTSGQEISGLATGTYDVQFKVAGTQTVLLDEPAVTIGTTPSTNEIEVVTIADSPTGSATPQTGLPVISVPVIAGATAPARMGHPTILGHPGMTRFPTMQ